MTLIVRECLLRFSFQFVWILFCLPAGGGGENGIVASECMSHPFMLRTYSTLLYGVVGPFEMCYVT